MAPSLTFFSELDAAAFAGLVAQPEVVATLSRRGAAVAMAVLDLSAERAKAVRTLNRAGVDVTAWLVLDHADGYWLTADNARAAHARYEAMDGWAHREGLSLSTVGLDIEMPHDDLVAVVEHPSALAHLWRRRRSAEQVLAARHAYAQLVERIRRDGRRVETYQMPLVADGRRARSSMLERVLGIVDIRPDREVLMLYRSTLPAPWGDWLVDAYGAEAEAIAIGITGGGVPSLHAAFEARQLDQHSLPVEMARARRHSEHLYVFSLEGCLESGLLELACRPPQAGRPGHQAGLLPWTRKLAHLAMRGLESWPFGRSRRG